MSLTPHHQHSSHIIYKDHTKAIFKIKTIIEIKLRDIWIGVIQKYLVSIFTPEFVDEVLCDPTPNRQSKKDTV